MRPPRGSAFARLAPLALAIATLSACGGGGGGGSALPSTYEAATLPASASAAAASPPAASVAAAAIVAMSVSIDLSAPATGRSARRRTRASISSLESSARVVAVTSGGSMTAIADCRTCTVVMDVPPGPVSVVAYAYDGAAGTGNPLAMAQGAVTANGASASLSLASWDPIVASVSFAATGAPLVDGVPGDVTLVPTAYDADGDALLGATPYAVPVALSLADPGRAFSLGTTALTAPGQTIDVAYDGLSGATGRLQPALPNATLAAVAIPIAPPSFRPRTHSRTIDFAYGAIADYDRAFGFSNWHAAAPYLDLVVAPAGLFDQHVRAGGIATSGYVDVNFCSGNFAAGPNAYPSPDCSKLSSDAFYSQDGHADRPLTMSYNGRVLQMLGNPSSASFQSAAVTAANGELARGDYDLMELDNTNDLDEIGYTMCYGTGTFAANRYSCAGSAGGPVAAPFTSQYSTGAWIAGMTVLAQTMPRPAILNGLFTRDPHTGRSAALDAILATPAAWGGLCDTCFYTSNARSAAGTLLAWQLQNAMTVTAAGKNVGVINDSASAPADRERGLAETMLFYDPDRTWTSGGPCGGTSMIHECPEQGLAFYDPVAPYPASPAAVQQPGGTYAREFRACYAGGVGLGPCAAVVNPDADGSHAMPALSRAYAHSLAISGDSLCACLGTQGSVAATGAAAPAMLPPASGYVIFP